MKKDFFVECWLFNQPITARIVINDLQVYREYHPVLVSNNCPVALKDFYFISGYGGTLEVNQPPANEYTAILLKELADAIEFQLKNVPEAHIISRPNYASHLGGGSPSAAA